MVLRTPKTAARRRENARAGAGGVAVVRGMDRDPGVAEKKEW